MQLIPGRSQDRKKAIRILSQRMCNSLMVLGEEGVGKSTFVDELIHQCRNASASPAGLRAKKFRKIDLSRFASPSSENELKGILSSASDESENTILVMENINQITLSRGNVFGDMVNVFRPALANGLQCIGIATPAQYSGSIGRDPNLTRYFQVLHLEEMNEWDTLLVLKSKVSEYEEHFGISSPERVLLEVIAQASQKLPDRPFPAKAIELLDRACSYTSQPSEEGIEHYGVLDSHAIEQALADILGERITEDKDVLARLESHLAQEVVGQPEATQAVANGVRCFRSGLVTNQHILNFIFGGGTGLGKTLMAKTLAQKLNYHLIRFDMSEFKHETDVVRFIGAPPSYKESDLGGQLTNAIRAYPRSVVLFDEIEKAHPRCLDILLHLLDEGYISDGMGQRASFRDAIVIMTSNLGGQAAHSASRSVEFLDSEVSAPVLYRQRILSALQEHLRPELLNRVQKVVYFYPLDRQAMRQVVELLVSRVCQRLAERHIKLELEKGAYELLIRKGYCAEYGAREAERVIGEFLIEPLAGMLLKHERLEGSEIRVSESLEALTFEILPYDLGGKSMNHQPF